VVGRYENLLHEESGESDDNAYDGRHSKPVTVVSCRLSSYPLLVDGAMARQVVERFVLQQVVTAAVLVVLASV